MVCTALPNTTVASKRSARRTRGWQSRAHPSSAQQLISRRASRKRQTRSARSGGPLRVYEAFFSASSRGTARRPGARSSQHRRGEWRMLRRHWGSRPAARAGHWNLKRAHRAPGRSEQRNAGAPCGALASEPSCGTARWAQARRSQRPRWEHLGLELRPQSAPGAQAARAEDPSP